MGNKDKPVTKNLYQILIVDDDNIVSESLAGALEIVGIYEVDVSNSGEDALEMVATNRFDAYLVDQRMPGMTGTEFIEELIKKVDDPLLYMITAEDDGAGLKLAELQDDEGGLPIKRYVPKPWPVSLFSVDLREDLRERDLIKDLTEAAIENSNRQREVQLRLENTSLRLDQAENKCRNIIDSVNDGVCNMNIVGEIDFTNKKAIELFQVSENEIIGKPVKNLFKKIAKKENPSNKISKRILSNLQNEVTELCEMEIVGSNSESQYLEFFTSPLFVMNDRIGTIITIRDITMRKKYDIAREADRQRDMHSARMMSIGELAASIAHELNQPLQTFKFSLHNIKKSILSQNIKPKILLNKMEKMDELSDFMATVITNLRGYAQPDIGSESMLLKDVLGSVKSIIGKRLANDSIAVKIDSLKNLKIYGNKSLIMQVFVNLMTNSLDAYTDLKSKKQKVIKITAKQGIKYATITFEDNAGGIPDNIKSKIFEPFISGKSSGKGMGMGLYITYEIIKESRGKISFTTKKNSGTKFTIKLPLSDKNKDEK